LLTGSAATTARLIRMLSKRKNLGGLGGTAPPGKETDRAPLAAHGLTTRGISSAYDVPSNEPDASHNDDQLTIHPNSRHHGIHSMMTG
jgi:hypothetical protein